MWISTRAFQRIFTCKIWLRYSRERALKSSGKWEFGTSKFPLPFPRSWHLKSEASRPFNFREGLRLRKTRRKRRKCPLLGAGNLGPRFRCLCLGLFALLIVLLLLSSHLGHELLQHSVAVILGDIFLGFLFQETRRLACTSACRHSILTPYVPLVSPMFVLTFLNFLVFFL